jgi:hypothetical protein
VKTVTGNTSCFRLVASAERRPPRQVSVSHDKSPPRMRSLRLASDNLLVHASSLYLRPRRGVRERSATPMHMLPRNDAWNASSPRHTNMPTGSKRGQSALTRALMRHCSAARPSTRHPIQPCSTPSPTQALECPLRLVLAYE